ncbi:hypothetical protein HPB48_016372 [Haemaphysalis longicornis]|uniref:Uncharacterized protein n=1 Tax=Haemaphysalis longicornis TaxID=44386 RepID=A0A9J6GIW1_HAELO|nr:hypothetical protein HPB48_016372 [Haemaphysalis longicornis]
MARPTNPLIWGATRMSLFKSLDACFFGTASECATSRQLQRNRTSFQASKRSTRQILALWPGRSPLKPATTATSNSKLPSNRPKLPRLPENDHKMAIRPRNGLALRKISPRLGESGTVEITFAGKKVPFFVYIRGDETRCYLYKRTHAFCHLSHATGHRADVCPQPTTLTDAHWKRCGQHTKQGAEHYCKPKCALCCADHVTDSKECPQRFLPPVNQRKKQRGSSQGHRESRSRSRSRGPFRDERKVRSTSKPRRRTPSAKRRTAEDATGVQTPPPPNPNYPKRDELADLKRLHAQLLAEIKQQRQENRQLYSGLLALKAEIRQGENTTPEKRKKPERP